MATLPEGMKMVKGTSGYGFTKYTYKGVEIHKYRDSWCFRTEYLATETGQFHFTDSYGSYKLAEVPATVERYLADTNYTLDPLRGSFILTEERKAELVELAKVRHLEWVTSAEEKLSEYLAQKDWDRLSSTAQHLVKYTNQHRWALEPKELVNA
jgi:hypothetical protein